MQSSQTFTPLESRFGDDPERNENILVIAKKREYNHICSNLYLFEKRCRVNPSHCHVEVIWNADCLDAAFGRIDLCCEICRINELRERENDN
jgi:hypothetical protein